MGIILPPHIKSFVFSSKGGQAEFFPLISRSTSSDFPLNPFEIMTQFGQVSFVNMALSSGKVVATICLPRIGSLAKIFA